jgi:hypothetical protein
MEFRRNRDKEMEERLLRELAEMGDDGDEEDALGEENHKPASYNTENIRDIQQLGVWSELKEASRERELVSKKFEKTLDLAKHINNYVSKKSTKLTRKQPALDGVKSIPEGIVLPEGIDYPEMRFAVRIPEAEDPEAEDDRMNRDMRAEKESVVGGDDYRTARDGDNESVIGSKLLENSVLDGFDEGMKVDLMNLRGIHHPVFTENQIEFIKANVEQEMAELEGPEYFNEEKISRAFKLDAESHHTDQAEQEQQAGGILPLNTENTD